MLSQSKIHSLVFGACLLLPALALPAVLTVNAAPGAIDSLNFDDTLGPTAFNFNQAVNGDNYNIAGTYSTSYTAAGGTFISLNVGATYLGSTTTTSTDTLTVDLFQNYFDSSPGTWDGTYHESSGEVSLSNAGAGSWVSVQGFWGVTQPLQGLPLLGPFSSPGTSNVPGSAVLTGLSGDLLMGELQVVFEFTPGTLAGASASSIAIPEPGFLPVGLGLLGVGMYFVRKRAAK
jgi:hypothetical protein